MENSLGFKDKHSLVLGKFKKTRIYYHFQERLMFFVVERPVKCNIGRHLRSKIRWRSDIIKAIIYRYCIDCHFNMFIYKVLDHSVSIAKFTKNSTLQKQPALRRILNAENCVRWLSKAKIGVSILSVFFMHDLTSFELCCRLGRDANRPQSDRRRPVEHEPYRARLRPG